MERKDLEKKFRHTWRNVIQRCTYPKDGMYSYYSKLGVSSDWMSFETFKRDMWSGFIEHCLINSLKNTTIDRIDTLKGYSKENCRWATWQVQGRNKKNNRVIKIGEESFCLEEWYEKIGHREALRSRIKRGWSVNM